MSPLYFAYGSNMSHRRLQARIPAARCLGAAHLDGFRLTFDKAGRDGSGKANLIAETGARRGGVLWSIEEPAWAILDRFEIGYRRETHPVSDSRGRSRVAGLYRAPGGGEEIPPFDWYLAYLVEGARENGLPRELIEELESRPCRPDPDPERSRRNA
jgi:hypothetical protein